MKEMFMLCEKISKEGIKRKDLNACWRANLKYDGERILAIKKDNEIFLINRRGKIKNAFYSEIVEDLNALNYDFIVDGEVITADNKFWNLQRRALTQNKEKQKELKKELPVYYMIFDVLSFNGIGLKQMPLKERIKYFSNFGFMLYVNFVDFMEINECLEFAEKNNYEGIIIKNMDSTYESKRSDNWLKLKFFKNTELKLISYTTNDVGIRCEDIYKNAIQIAGEKHKEVKNQIDKNGFCDVIIQYLEKGESGRYRFPSFVKIK